MSRSDEGERTCPLCLEEMDLTDQQLKPCKCGYEICVWCWHHIMEMAEKDGTDGRCPACRCAYDKERIVGMSANCERLVSEVNADRRSKTQKGKPKITAEARKQLTDVRVIQRNLVYVVGMSPTVADAHILERKEYFGQYGKIMKISISRTSSGGAQQSTSSTAVGVYITYAREEEAVRCIQAVNNFLLEGKPLRACFGTTKYCHSWIRNMTCSNPDCYYLHDICSQEDSFLKNEIISAYTRLPQTTSTTSRHRSGNILPPPADDVLTYNSVSSSKHSATYHKGSPPNGSGTCDRSTVIRAATTWGSRSLGSTSVSLSSSQGSKDHSQEVSFTNQSSSRENNMVRMGKIPEVRLEDGILKRFGSCKVSCSNVSLQGKMPSTSFDVNLSSAWHDTDEDPTSITAEGNCTTAPNGSFRFLDVQRDHLDGKLHASDPLIDECTNQLITSAWDDDDDDDGDVVPSHNPLVDGEAHSSSRCKSPITLVSQSVLEHGFPLSDEALDNVLDSDSTPENMAFSLCISSSQQCTDTTIVPCNIACPSTSALLETPTLGSMEDDYNTTSGNLEDTNSSLSLLKCEDQYTGGSNDDHDLVGNSSSFMTGLQSSQCQLKHLDPAILTIAPSFPEEPLASEVLPDLITNLRKTKLPSMDNQNKSAFQSSLYGSSHTDCFLHTAPAPLSISLNLMPSDHAGNVPTYPCSGNYSNNHMSGSLVQTGAGCSETSHIQEASRFFFPNGNRGSNFINFDENKIFKGNSCSSNSIDANSRDTGEETIISNILSMDFDPWSDSLSANDGFIKLLRGTGIQRSQQSISGSLMPQNNNQSRFSFARQDGPTLIGMPSTKSSTSQDPLSDLSINGVASTFPPQAIDSLSGHSAFSLNRIPAVSRAKVTPPPGFSVQTRAPPPGFSCPSNANLSYGHGCSGFQILESSSQRMPDQLQQSGSSIDVEFIDPAILAVVRGSSPVSIPNDSSLGSFHYTQSSMSLSDSRYPFLMNQSIPPPKNPRISSCLGENLLPLNDHQPILFDGHDFSTSSPMQRFIHPSEESYLSNNLFDRHCSLRLGSELSAVEYSRKRFGPNSNLTGSENFQFQMVNPSSQFGPAFGL